jgi:hypothetical protein
MEEARTSGFPQWRNAYALAGHSWEAEIELGRALILEARGRYSEADSAYRVAEIRRQAAIPGLLKTPNPPPLMQLGQTVDLMVVAQAMKAQGRLAEAEARRALLSRLKDQGTTRRRRYYHDARVLVEQGRHSDAGLIQLRLKSPRRSARLPKPRPPYRCCRLSRTSLRCNTRQAAEVYARPTRRWQTGIPRFARP